MTISELLLPEFDQEMANTRKILERVPEDKYAWQPHEKSMSMMRLASHISELPHWAVETINRRELHLKPGEKPFIASSNAELMANFEKHVAEARAAISSASDEELSKDWSLMLGGKAIFTSPRSAVLRNVVMNHLIHHRAQLGVYLRLNDVPIPGLYGPSADDNASFPAAKS